MGKCIGYTAGAITFMGIGALVTGLALYFTYPEIRNGGASSKGDEEMRSAKCVLTGTVTGNISFAQNMSDSSISITGDVMGLISGTHGFHIHEFGGLGNSCKDAGAHFNPDNKAHGGPDSAQRHVGDLGNIQSVGTGSPRAVIDIEDSYVTLYGDQSVVGRAVVIHELEDDLGASGDSAGAAGARVACCTIYFVAN